jgi:hypothetical protein
MPIIKIVFLDYGGGNGRYDILAKNIISAGYDISNIEIVNVSPLSRALNYGLKDFETYDAVGFLANDIIEPDNWLLKKSELIFKHKVSIASSFPSEPIPYGDHDLIGNYLISKEAINKLGHFNEEYFNYGPIDLDYCNRARHLELSLKYIDTSSTHIEGNNSDLRYGFSKSEAVLKSWPLYLDNLSKYNSGINICQKWR